MTATGNDCYYYYSGTCVKGDHCNFRHQPAALGSEVTCGLWKQGICARPVCEFRHAILNKNNGLVKCMWENQPSGCLKPNCTFFHTKPKHVPSNVPGCLPQPPFSTTGPMFRPLGRGELSQFGQEQSKGTFGHPAMTFLDKHLTPGLPMSSGIAGGGQNSLTNSTSLLGNPPFLVNMLGADPTLLNLSNADTSLQEQVKRFQQMLDRIGKQESPRKDKDKSKRRVIPKDARFVDELGFDKAERKREGSKKKRNKEKSRKSERKDRSYKSKGKSEHKRREERFPKLGGERDFDEETNEGEPEPSDFTESPRSRRSSSEYEGLDFGVKSYEEILREKALRNLLEKKKLREQNETGIPDESNRAKIEEIEKELREVSRARQRKEKEDGERGLKKEEGESVKEESPVQDDPDVEESGAKEIMEARVEGEDSQLDGDVGSPVSSEISLQADDEDLSFGEDEGQSKSPQKGGSGVAKLKKERKRDKEREKRSQKRRDRVIRDVNADDQGRGRTERREAGEGKRVVSMVKEESKVDTGKDGEQTAKSLNKSLDLGIKTFEEIMAEKRQRKKTVVSECEPGKQPVSTSKSQEGSLYIANVSQKEERGKNGSQSAKNQGETIEQKGKRVIRKIPEQEKVDDKKQGELAEAVTRHKLAAPSAPALATLAVSPAKKEAVKTAEVLVINALKSSLEPVASLSASELKQEPPLKVKSFEEIMREKRARQQQTQQAEKTKQKKEDGANNELKGSTSGKTKVRHRGVAGSEDGARARRFIAATAIGVSVSKSEDGAVGTGTITERTRRLLLKRPSTKPKSIVEDVKVSEAQSSNLWPQNTQSELTDSGPMEGTEIEKVASSAEKTRISAVSTATTTVASFHERQSAVTSWASPVGGNDKPITKITNLRHDGNDSIVARVSPFIVTTAETPSSSTEQQTYVSSSRTVISSSSATKDEPDARPPKPLKSPRERRKSESARKRRSNEEPKTPVEESFDREQGPSPTKRAKPTSRDGSGITKDFDDSERDEALETEERRNSEYLLDEELEREIANLSPLSGESYDEIDEDDLLMEVEAIINE